MKRIRLHHHTVVTKEFLFPEMVSAASVQLHKSVIEQEQRLHIIIPSLYLLSICLHKPSKDALDGGLVFVSKYLLGKLVC